MSEEASNLAEGELEQLTDRLEETTLDEMHLNLAALIREANAGVRAGKDEGLGNAIASVKSALEDKSVSLSTLMECEELLSVLISGLETDSSSVQLDTLAILALMSKEGTDPQKKKVVGSGIIPALITLLTSEEATVCGEVLAALHSISEDFSNLGHFSQPEFIPALIKLAERAENMKWLQDIAWIVGRFCSFRRATAFEDPLREGEREWILPSLPVVREIVQLFLILMKGKDDEVVGSSVTIHMTLSLAVLCEVEGGFEVIFSSGLVPWVVDTLSSSRKEERLTATIAIAKLGAEAKSDAETIQFLQALQGLSGMKEICRNLLEASDDSEEGRLTEKKISSHWNTFLGKVRRALEGEQRSKVIEAVIQSGFLHTLVTFLEMRAPEEPQVTSIFLLDLVLREMGEGKVELVMEMGVVPLVVELLKSRTERVRLMAPSCLKHLMKHKDTLREEIVSRGGLHQMIRMLKKECKNFGMVLSILICLEEVFRQTPKLPLEQFKGLAEALKLVWGNMARFSRKNKTDAGHVATGIFFSLKEIGDYGTSGIDLIRTSGNFEVLIGGLSSELLSVQKLAMGLIVHASLLKQGNRETLMKLGLLDSFPGLFRNPVDGIIQLVLICLKIFLYGKLSAAQTKAILGMKSLVEAEMLRDIKVTSRAASMLLSRMGEIEK